MSHVIWMHWVTILFIVRFEHLSKWWTYSTVWLSGYMVNATWNCCRLGACSMNTTQPCTSLQCHFIQSHANILPPALLAEWPRSFLHATAVTWGCSGYWNKSEHRQLTVGKKIIPLLLPGLEPETFWSRSRVQCQGEGRVAWGGGGGGGGVEQWGGGGWGVVTAYVEEWLHNPPLWE